MGFSLAFGVSGQSVERPVQPNIPGDIMIDFGFNFMNQFPEFLSSDFFPSRSFGVYYQRTFKIFDWATFNPAIGIGNDRFGWSDDLNFIQDTSRTFSFDTITGINLRKNMLIFSYLEIPAELRFYPTKTIDGDGFFIGVGGMIGVRINAHTKIKYKFAGDIRTEKNRSGFGLNNVRYGITGRVGWKQFNIFYKHYLSDLFQKSPELDPFPVTNPYMFTIGINFTGF